MLRLYFFYTSLPFYLVFYYPKNIEAESFRELKAHGYFTRRNIVDIDARIIRLTFTFRTTDLSLIAYNHTTLREATATIWQIHT